MKKEKEKPSEVDVVVNASCEILYGGFRYGAGAQVRMPFEEAVFKAQQGVVTLLVSPKEIIKENNDADTQ